MVLFVKSVFPYVYNTSFTMNVLLLMMLTAAPVIWTSHSTILQPCLVCMNLSVYLQVTESDDCPK